VSSAVVENPKEQLDSLLASERREEASIGRGLVEEFARRFSEAHELQIRFTDAAVERLIAAAAESAKPLRDLCAEKFKDFQFGLRLIAQNTGQREFVLDTEAVDAPDKTLSEWVVASYRQTHP
jgi:hypothetical protein